MSKRAEITETEVGGMLTKVGNAMATLQNGRKKVPEDVRRAFMRIYRDLMTEVQAHNFSLETFVPFFADIAVHLRRSLAESNVIVPSGHTLSSTVRKRSSRLEQGKLSGREQCTAYVGSMIRFGDGYEEHIREKPAMVVDVNSKRVVLDRAKYEVGFRYKCDDHNHIVRMEHKKFLQKLELGKIRVISQKDMEIWNVEKSIAKNEMMIDDLQEEKDVTRFIDLVFTYAYQLKLPLFRDQTPEQTSARIIEHLREGIAQDNERLEQLTT